MISDQVQELLVRGRNAFRIHDYVTAQSLVQQMLDEYPESITGTILLGIIAGRTGDPAGAIRSFKKALQLDPDNAEAYNNLAVILRQQDRLKDALAAVRKAESLNPERPDILYNKGNILKDLEKIDQAIAAYKQALKVDDQFVLAYNNLGTLYQAQGDTNRAMETFGIGLSIDPNHPTLRYNLGLAYETQGQLQDAESEYNRSLRARPGWGEALNNLGIVYQKQERFDDAEKTFREAIAIKKENPRAHNNLATNFAMQGRTREAMQYYRMALESDPTYSHAAGNLGQLLDTRTDVGDAIDELQQLANLDTGNIDLQLRLAIGLLRSNRLETAERVLLKILSIDDRHLEGTRHLADAYFRQGKDDKAEECYRRITTISAEYAAHLLDRAIVYQLRGQTVEGIREIDRYLEREPGSLEALLVKASLLVDHGNQSDAVQMLEGLRNLYPGDGRVLAALASAHQHSGQREEAIRAVDELINLQGSRANPEDITALNESLELYEQAVDAFAAENQTDWERNLRRLGELSQPEHEEVEQHLDVDEIEGLDEDSIPILSFGGEELMEPDEWEVQVHDEEPAEEDYLGVEPPEELAQSLTTIADQSQMRGGEQFADSIGRPSDALATSPQPQRPQAEPQRPQAEPQRPQAEPQRPQAEPQAVPPAPQWPQAVPPAPQWPQAAPQPQAPTPQIPGPQPDAPRPQPDVPGPQPDAPPPPAQPGPPQYIPVLVPMPPPVIPEPKPEPDPTPDSDLELESEPEIELEPETADGDAGDLADDFLTDGLEADDDFLDGGFPDELEPDPGIIEELAEPESGDEPFDSLFEPPAAAAARSAGAKPRPPAVDPPDPGPKAKLLDYLSGLTAALPEKKQDEYRHSEFRLKLESLRSRLAGRPGLRRDGERYTEGMHSGPVDLTPQRLTDTLRYIGEMSTHHPDIGISSALRERVATVLDRLRRMREGSS